MQPWLLVGTSASTSERVRQRGEGQPVPSGLVKKGLVRRWSALMTSCAHDLRGKIEEWDPRGIPNALIDADLAGRRLHALAENDAVLIQLVHDLLSLRLADVQLLCGKGDGKYCCGFIEYKNVSASTRCGLERNAKKRRLSSAYFMMEAYPSPGSGMKSVYGKSAATEACMIPVLCET